ANRHTEPARLSKEVRGELDWIVMKSLEKDRNRRYETAAGLGRDIECYLHDEPVQACPPSAVYRLRRFVRRNKVAAAFVALLLVSVVGLAISNLALKRERDAKTAALEAWKQHSKNYLFKHPVEDRVQYFTEAIHLKPDEPWYWNE